MGKRKSSSQGNGSDHPLEAILNGRWPELLPDLKDIDLFTQSIITQDILDIIEKAMIDAGWSRTSQIALVRFLVGQTKESIPDFRVESAVQWIKFHKKDDADAVIDCIRLIPPPEVTVIGRLPRTGSQKIVFRASWKLQERPVVLKKLLSNVLQRELQSHPLSANHPNIIKTYTASNAKGERFLIEEFLDEVLGDRWVPGGVEDTALLLHDIGAALAFIKAQGLIHGDVKPDNIGRHAGRFILLDFGICRPATDFSFDASATGSLRTRAPELLVGDNTHSIASDVWALAAVIARLCCGRFPLIEPDEIVPRVSEPEDRSSFEAMLKSRTENEYEGRITQVLTSCSDSRIKDILRQMLNRCAAARPEPAKVVELVKSHLGYAIPESEGDAPWASSPSREIDLLWAQWPDDNSVMRIPPTRITVLRKHVEELERKLRDAPAEYKERAKQLRERLRERVAS